MAMAVSCCSCISSTLPSSPPLTPSPTRLLSPLSLAATPSPRCLPSFRGLDESCPLSFKFDDPLKASLTRRRLGTAGPSSLNVVARSDCATQQTQTKDDFHRHSRDFAGVRKTYYTILGVPQDASQNDIRLAYRKLALQFHPDMAPLHQLDTATKIFSQINDAYATLSDQQKRKRYDLKLALQAPATLGAAKYGNTNKYTDLSTGRTYSSITSFYREWKGNQRSTWETDQCWC